MIAHPADTSIKRCLNVFTVAITMSFDRILSY